MFSNLKSFIGRNITNARGWRTNRKIIIIESDDWGSIRMSSKKGFNNLLNKGYNVDKCIYNANDMLESNNDLERLFDVLNSVKDKNGNPSKFTINNVVANPDFKKIRESGFKEYFFEVFSDTLNKYPHHDKVMSLYKQGIKHKLINPQFHGREHVNVDNWLLGLQNEDKMAMDAFSNEMFSTTKGRDSNCMKEYLNAFAVYNKVQFKNIAKSVEQGLDLFEKIWGFRSKTIIAPCYTWGENIEPIFYQGGIKIIQTSGFQRIPIINSSKNKIKRRYAGEKSKNGLIYTVRNVLFEPTENQNFDWVNSSLKEIEMSFFWKKPAVISTHRVNYIMGLNKNNSDESLRKLRVLLINIVKKWPDVEFMSSDQLCDVILNN